MICVALENTDSISTNSTGSVGNAGGITRLIRKCFCFLKGVTAVHLLNSSFLGLRGFIGTGSWFEDWEGCNHRLQASPAKLPCSRLAQRSHATGKQGRYFVIKPRPPGLVLGHDVRLKTAVSVAGNLDVQFAKLALERFTALAP